MPFILDQYSGDPTHALLFDELASRPQALEAVKTASFDRDAAQALPSTAFAWEGLRRFPVHTKEDTIASLVYRSKCAAEVPAYVDAKLGAAAAAYGVKEAFFGFGKKKTEEAPASPPTVDNLPPGFRLHEGRLYHAFAPGVEFSVPMDRANAYLAEVHRNKTAAAPAYALEAQQRLPLGSPEQVKLAEEVLIRDVRVLPLTDRVEAFTKVALAAEALGLPVSRNVGVYAGRNVCYTQVLRDRIGMRASRTKVAGCSQVFHELDAALGAMPPVLQDRGALLKLAARLEELDQIAGLTSDYDKKIFDPMKTVFNGRDKIAQAGEDYQKLMSLPPEVWDQVDVPELKEIAQGGDLAQFQQVYDTLPADIKMIIRSQFG